jgi:hypothetical protein
MKIALLFLSHQHSDIFKDFLKYIDNVDGFYPFLHHDFSQSNLSEDVLNNKKLIILENWYRTAWSDISVVQATLSLLHEAFHSSQNKYEWFLLLSSSCYPTRPLINLSFFLESTDVDGFMENTRLNKRTNWLHAAYHKQIYTKSLCSIPFISRRGKFYWRDLRIKYRKTPFNKDLYPYFGSQWWGLRRNVVQEILFKTDWIESMVTFACKNKILASEEWLIQSVVASLKDFKIKSKNLHFIDWENAQNWHPNILTENHLEPIISSGAFFARKFDKSKSSSLLQTINQEILHLI